MTNSELIELLQKGDEQSFTKLFEVLYQPMVAYLLQYVNKVADAEDIAQNTFIKLWEKKDDLNLTVSLKSYLYSIAYNMFIDNYRKEKKTQTYLDSLKQEALQSIIEEPEENFQKKMRLIEQTVNNLPKRCRIIFNMHKKQGCSHKEIAKELNISTKTVESQISIALKRIREVFKDKSDLFLFVLFYAYKTSSQ